MVGVDGALLVSPYSMYGYDASYALEVYARRVDLARLIWVGGDPGPARQGTSLVDHSCRSTPCLFNSR